jgi:hypothetical protein
LPYIFAQKQAAILLWCGNTHLICSIAHPAMTNPRRLDGRLILIVERSWVIASAFVDAFEANGARVVLVSVARRDLADLPQLAAAVLEGESLDLCRLLEAKGIPFVLYTSYGQSERQFTRATVVEKPAPLTDVVAAVEQLRLPFKPQV